MVLTLSRLPPDYLALLFNGPVTSHLILRLWKCGDALLNTKLAKAITHIDLKHHASMLCHYPRLLSNFGLLRILSLETGSMDIKAPGSEDLMNLPNTLESLIVPATVFLDFRQRYSFSAPLERIIDVSSLFPSLRILKVDFEEMLAYHARAYGSVFSHLPATLTHLSWPRICLFAAQPTLMSVLPRSLTVLDTILMLELHTEEIPASVVFDMSMAPPGLHTITKVELIGPCELSDYRWLPKSLTRCNLFTSIAQWSGIRNMHQGVTKLLQIDDLPSDVIAWASALPRGLEALQINIGPRLNSAEISSLPPSLTSLKGRFEWKTTHKHGTEGSSAMARVWPPGLTKLEDSLFVLSTGTMALLPQTLTSMSLRGIDIEGLDIDTAPYRVSDFPPLLTQLCLHVQCYDPLEFDLTSLTALKTCEIDFPAYCTRKLPMSVTKLNFPRINVEQLYSLPSALVSLKISFGTVEVDAFISSFSEFPPTLKELELTAWPKTDGSRKTPPIIPSTVFNALPELKVILFYNNAMRFESSVLRELHEHNHKLLHLILPLTALCREDVPYLPPTLVKVELDCMIDWSWPEIEQYWPTLGIQESDILDSRFPAMPADLKARLALKARQKYCQ